MTSSIALPTEIRLMIFDALFDDETEQYYPHPMLELSEQTSPECAPYLFRHLQLNIVYAPQLGYHGEDQIVTFFSHKREWGPYYGSILDEVFVGQKTLSKLLPHVQQVKFQYFGFQGRKMWLANVTVPFDVGELFAYTVDYAFPITSDVHPAVRTLFRRKAEAAINTFENCSAPHLAQFVNALRYSETGSSTSKRRDDTWTFTLQ